MPISWTAEQQQVIKLRHRNILVSAAAGSGKTAVLVERIIKIITDREHPVDIDRLLIVTFTNAAAAEMRERIGQAIERALEKAPGDEHLLRQLTLIHNAQITTIDSFCLYVIRSHFHEIDLEPNFRIGDEGELKLLKEDIQKKVLERNYEEKSPEFTAFAEGYASGKSDAALSDMILKLYEFSRSYPWPFEWLDSCAKGYTVSDETELNDAVWMKSLVDSIRFSMQDLVSMMRQALTLTQDSDGPGMYEKAIQSDLMNYEKIAQCRTYTEFAAAFSGLSYERFAAARGFEGSAEKQELVKGLRNSAKETVKKITRQYFFTSPQVMLERLGETGPMASELVRLTREFTEAFAAEKRRKNLVDFHDLEHFALQILVDEETKKAKKAAEEFRDTFEEIMIDEYQDSNHVQEAILRSISREERGGHNIFMVGDVKQSIYRFRLARPELFMEKYDTYSTKESVTQRIDLHKNFRSRDEVLSCTNAIFYRIMARDLGNVSYDEEAALNPGASYPKAEGRFLPELLLSDQSDELLLDTEYKDKKLLEAKLVAERIKKLKQEQLVTDKETGELRGVRYSDIVILLRSLNGWADTFASVLTDAGIPAHTVSSSGYFSAVEVQTVLAMLRILDNPRQDIPLAAVLRSPIAGFSDEELALLSLDGKEGSFHERILCQCALLREKAEETLTGPKQKLKRFYSLYQKLRALVPDTPIHELIELLLKETGYGYYAAAMPAGGRRRANLLMLVEKAIAYETTSYKGLFHFVRYIDELQKYDVDFGEADLVGEGEDVVRIMSIHKSKGLEFPVVFVSGLGKAFNRQDTRSNLVLHPELGLGMDDLNGQRRIKSPTIAKKAIARRVELENLGEELRVLYVALTRAKEKLIMTGSLKEAPEAVRQLAQELKLSYGTETLPFEREVRPLSYLRREGASCCLEWVLPAVLSYTEYDGEKEAWSGGKLCEVRVVTAAELAAEEVQTQVRGVLSREEMQGRIKHADKAIKQQLEERFSYQYPYQANILRKNKYSVSELKHRAMRERMEQEETELTPAFLKPDIIPYIPSFARNTEEEHEDSGQGALRGTAVHRVMECYDFASNETPQEQLERMLAEEKITKSMKELIKIPQIEAFAASKTGQRMREAVRCGKLYREKPFVMGFTEAELESFGFGAMDAENGRFSAAELEKDLTLIQGIIDVFWIEEDGIVLLDYKTDRVETDRELTDRYAAQLALYAEALERFYNPSAERNIKVKEKLLYSFRLGKIIACGKA